jgi:outer membrane protein assembly factor BamD
MRAKLAVGDTWFKEGGTAALTQAEAEYKDFITFFPMRLRRPRRKMKVGDIYYEQMEKPDRDYTNAQKPKRAYREMINMFPDSTLVPRAKQKLRDVQEVLAERESQIGLYYGSRENFNAAIARLETVVDTYPLYSKSDQALLGIGDAYAGHCPHHSDCNPKLPGAIKERMRCHLPGSGRTAYAKVITRYPMAPHVEDARDRLVAMNRPVPEPTQAAIAESDAEERSRQPLHFTDKTLGLIKRGPTVVEAVHVGEPSLDDPKRTLAPDITKQKCRLLQRRPSMPASGLRQHRSVAPTGPNEPPRSDQPNQAPLQLGPPGGRHRRGCTGRQRAQLRACRSDAVVKPVGPANTTLPAVEKRPRPPEQVNDIKPGSTPTSAANPRRCPKEEAQGRSERRIVQQEEKEEGAEQAESLLDCGSGQLKSEGPSGGWPFAFL